MKIHYLNSEENFTNQIKRYHEQYDKLFFITQDPILNQNPIISQQFSLWDRSGSEVIQGNLLVLPIGQSLLYVEPVYLKASQGGLPTLTRIVVSDGKRIAMAETLNEGIKALLDKTCKNDDLVQ